MLKTIVLPRQARDKHRQSTQKGLFLSAGLTLNTNGMRKLGVISRRAIVAGSRPPAEELAQYDLVAACGMVPAPANIS